jgi:MFS family permease
VPATPTPFFHGWRIVGVAAFIHFLHGGLLMQAFGAYVAVLSEEFGWSKTALSAGAAIQSLEAAVLGPALGWFMDRIGARLMVQIGIVLFGLGFIGLSQVDSIGGFYAAVLLIALGSSLSGYFPLSVTVMHWFRLQRARALSIMGMGLAGGGIMVPAVAWMMQAYGWPTSAGLRRMTRAAGQPSRMASTPETKAVVRQP